MTAPGPGHACADAEEVADRILKRHGPSLKVALPLGLGKPVRLVDALVGRAEADPSIEIEIFTALTLERPAPKGGMARRFLAPALERLFGAYEAPRYARLIREGRLPANVRVREFFLQAGRWTHVDAMQRAYTPVDYAHAVPLLRDWGPDVVLQLVAPAEGGASLSCNTDISADLMRLRRAGEMAFTFAAEINDDLPSFGGDAWIAEAEIDLLLGAEGGGDLFSAPRRAVSDAEHAIGLHVAGLVPDGGTLQIGIGSIGDAVAQALILRHEGRIAPARAACPFPAAPLHQGRFETGLHVVTEMLVEGLLRLFEAGIARRVADGAAMHAAFFVESRDFYRRLRDMPESRRAEIAMRPVSYTNRLIGDTEAKIAARTGARFVNAAMKVTLTGETVSDTTAAGRMVSGVGGQMDFVQQAFDLPDARSIIALPAVRGTGQGAESNIVWSFPHATVPRHLRDIVVTEYGVADLRWQSDEDAAAALIAIADSRFQDGLARQAIAAGRLPAGWQVPPERRRNTPRAVADWIDGAGRDRLPVFPFGTAFDAVEQRLLPALELLKAEASGWRGTAAHLWRGLRHRGVPEEAACLERMDLAAPRGLRERAEALALRAALRRTD